MSEDFFQLSELMERALKIGDGVIEDGELKVKILKITTKSPVNLRELFYKARDYIHRTSTDSRSDRLDSLKFIIRSEEKDILWLGKKRIIRKLLEE